MHCPKGVIILDLFKDENIYDVEKMLFSIEKNISWLKEIIIICDNKNLNLDNIKNLKVNLIHYNSKINNYSKKKIELQLFDILDLKENVIYFPKIGIISKNILYEELFNRAHPKYLAILQPIAFGKTYEKSEELTILENCTIINSCFNISESIKKNLLKWISIKYFFKLFNNLRLFFWRKIVGFYVDDSPQFISYDTYKEIWALLNEEIQFHINKEEILNIPDYRLFIYWKIIKGEFYSKSLLTIRKFKRCDYYDNI